MFQVQTYTRAGVLARVAVDAARAELAAAVAASNEIDIPSLREAALDAVNARHVGSTSVICWGWGFRSG